MKKQNIANELKAFAAGMGVWSISSIVIMLFISMVWGVNALPGQFGVLITIIGLAAGIYVAYLVNNKQIPSNCLWYFRGKRR